MNLMDDGKTLNIKADLGFTSSMDPCETTLFSSNNIGQYQYDLKTAVEALGGSFLLTKFLDNWVFLNNTLFIFA